VACSTATKEDTVLFLLTLLARYVGVWIAVGFVVTTALLRLAEISVEH